MRWFWLIWITTTAVAVICVALAVGQAAAPSCRNAAKRPVSFFLTLRQVGTSRAVVALTLLAVFLACYIALILAWDDFAYFDNEYFTLGPLRGHNIAVAISRETGRFFPLGFQEFNLVRHFTDTINGYRIIPLVQLLILFCILLILDDDISFTARAALAILALLTPSILTSFSGLIFTERNFLFFLGCLALSIKRFEQTQSIASAVAAVVSAQIMIYNGETASLLLLGFAAGRVILRCKSGPGSGWDYDRLWDKLSRLDLTLAFLGVLFLLYYVAEMGIYGNMSYAAMARQPRAEVVLAYVRADVLAWLFVAFVLGRVYLILRRSVMPLLLWDGLALGGVTCFAAYLYLSMFSTYYLAPVDLIGVLYIGRFTVLSWKNMEHWGRIAALLLAVIVLLQDVVVSAFAAFERKNYISARVAMASVVEAQYRSRAGGALKLFFPFTNPYVIMEFGSYLTYRGLPVEGVEEEAPGAKSVLLSTTAVAADGRCVYWTRIRCHAVKAPVSGDLVIVLPDDKASLAEASLYRKAGEGEQLLSYEPRPQIPNWLRSLFDSLHLYTTRYTPKTNPDRWMDGSITKWK